MKRPALRGRRRYACRALAATSLMFAATPLAGLVVHGSPASALAPTSSGYWTKLAAPVPLVPAGGLYVANDPTSAVNPADPVGGKLPVPVPVPNLPSLPAPTATGPTAITEIQITGIDAKSDATLTLKVSPGSVVPPATLTTIAACPLAGAWQTPPKAPGDINHAPAYTCSTSSTGKVAGDNTSISWLLPATMQTTPGELDVALVPNPAGLPIAFSVAFDAPGSSAVQAPAGAPSPPPPVLDTGMPQVAAPILPSVATPLATAGPVGGSPIPNLAPPSVSPAPVAVGAATGGGGQTQLSIGNLAGVHLPGDDRAHRIMAVALLLGMAAAWWWVGGQAVRNPRLLGALAAGGDDVTTIAVGGVGRFSRPRTVRPRRL